MNDKGMITIKVMSALGHTEMDVTFEGALDLLKKEMGAGKWLLVTPAVGKPFVKTSITALTADMDAMREMVTGARNLTLTQNLLGGVCCGGVKAADPFRFDADGFDADGFDADGYDDEGYDRDGFDVDGLNVDGENREEVKAELDGSFKFDADGYDRNGYDIDGLDRNGNPAKPATEEFNLIVVSEVNHPEVIAVTADSVVFNRGVSKEVFADAVVRLLVAIEKTVPELMAGKVKAAAK